MSLEGENSEILHQEPVDTKKDKINVANQKETDFSKKTEEKGEKTELLSRLKDIKDIDSLRAVLSEVVWKMETQFLEVVKNKTKNSEILDALEIYDGHVNLEDSAKPSVFEQKAWELLEQAEQIMLDVEMWTSEAKVLDEFFSQMSSDLVQFQAQAEDHIIEDIKDWMISNKEFIEVNDLNWMLNRWWEKLFNEHNTNIWKFKEIISKKPMASLIWEVFSIDYWAWAFNDWYEEIKSRLKWKNLFQEIDNITSKDSENDWTREMLKWKAMRSLLRNWKIQDFDNYFSWYKKSDEIKQRIKKAIEVSNLGFENMPWTLPWEEEFLWDFVAHFDEIKKSTSLRDIALELEKKNPIVEQFKPMREEIYKQVPDVYQEGIMKWLFIYGNDKLAWAWVESFKKNIEKYKWKPYFFTREIDKSEDEDMEYITLGKENSEDRITFALLKQTPPENEEDEDKRPDSYARGLSKLKDKWFNTFSLRCHCYNTNVMASTLANLGMTDKWSILIDGWCGNAKVIGDYVSQWLDCHMFSYTDTWKWATTEALFDHILKWKDKKSNIWEIVNSIKTASKQSNSALNWTNTMRMPWSEAYLYAIIKNWEKDEIASADIDGEYEEE